MYGLRIRYGIAEQDELVGVGIVVWNGIPRARSRLEKLLVELEIPTDLSSECPSLHKWARLAGNDTNGIGALVAIRNAFVTLLKYDGPIYSRLRNGLTREVRVEKPWVPD